MIPTDPKKLLHGYRTTIACLERIKGGNSVDDELRLMRQCADFCQSYIGKEDPEETPDDRCHYCLVRRDDDPTVMVYRNVFDILVPACEDCRREHTADSWKDGECSTS